MLNRIDDIIELFETRGSAWYGNEAVSQLDHALQCANLAAESGAEPELVVASLLHDIGHLLTQQDESLASERDDVHQFIMQPFLRDLFPEAVLAPIRMHVDAKRYLCATEPGYREALSPASRTSLELQGGAFNPDMAGRFISLSYAKDAVNLRRWDDLAKTPGALVPPLASFADLMERASLRR